jgi:hypothetical protein
MIAENARNPENEGDSPTVEIRPLHSLTLIVSEMAIYRQLPELLLQLHNWCEMVRPDH